MSTRGARIRGRLRKILRIIHAPKNYGEAPQTLEAKQETARAQAQYGNETGRGS